MYPDETESPKDSKSQRKREMFAVGEMVEELIRLPPAELASMPLSDDVRDAVVAAECL